MDERIRKIRESERQSHTVMYSNSDLYNSDSWLSKPIKTVRDLLPYFADYSELNVLDFGCGVGRNCIPIAAEYRRIDCAIDCVDILEIAIEKLNQNAERYSVTPIIRGIVSSIEDYPVAPNAYDLILAVSALEHIDSEAAFISKLEEIRDGTRGNGIVCLVVNSNIRENDTSTGDPLPPQFEINLPTEKLKTILNHVFTGWEILKETTSNQHYDIPRGSGICELNTSVVTLVARKTSCV